MTKIQFEINRTHGGWEHSKIPDDMSVTFRSENNISASLSAFIELYAYVINRRECRIVTGTGEELRIEEHEDNSDYITFGVSPTKIVMTYDDLQEALESLLPEAFEEFDDVSEESEREQAIADIQKTLNKNKIDCNVGEIYEKFNN